MVDDDCSLQEACSSHQCVDPCLSGTCSNTDFCKVISHRPICGYHYQPQHTIDNSVVGQKRRPQRRKQSHHLQPIMPDISNPFVIGGEYREVEVLDPPERCDKECQPRMMMMMNTSGLPVIGYSSRMRRRRRERGGRRTRQIKPSN